MRAGGVALLLAASALSGCATTATTGSFVQAPATIQSSQIASNLTGLVAHVLPPAHSVLTVEPPAGNAAKAFASKFKASLRDRGFGLTDHGGVPVRYAVTPFQRSILLRVWTNRDVVSRAYQPDKAGALVPVSPMTVGRG